MGGDLAGAMIVFDLDGTLVDTAPDLLRALNLVLAEESMEPVAEERLRLMVGQGARRLIERAAALRGKTYDEARLDVLTERFVDFYRADIASGSRPFPGVVEAMDALAARGALLTVCTNKRTELSVLLLDALGLTSRFAAIVGADAVTERKPSPVHYLETVRRGRGRVDYSLMVGDSEADLLSAQAAGAPCVLVSFGYCDGGAARLGADFLLDSYEELAPICDQIFLARRAPRGA
jgi:phosphoglycolate phosphatase